MKTINEKIVSHVPTFSHKYNQWLYNKFLSAMLIDISSETEA